MIMIAFLFSCKNKEKSSPFISSNDPGSLVIGLNSLDANDTMYLDQILKDPYDERISFSLKYYGQSVYQAKMNALQRISKLPPPHKITNEPDSTIIDFYKDWASNRIGK